MNCRATGREKEPRTRTVSSNDVGGARYEQIIDQFNLGDKTKVEEKIEEASRLWRQKNDGMERWIAAIGTMTWEALEVAAHAGRLSEQVEITGARKADARCEPMRETLEDGRTQDTVQIIAAIERGTNNRRERQLCLFESKEEAETKEGRRLEEAIHKACRSDPSGPIADRNRGTIEERIGKAIAGSSLARVELGKESEHPNVLRAINAFATATPTEIRERWRTDHAKGGNTRAEQGIGEMGEKYAWKRDLVRAKQQLQRWCQTRKEGLTKGLGSRHRQRTNSFRGGHGKSGWKRRSHAISKYNRTNPDRTGTTRAMPRRKRGYDAANDANEGAGR